MTPAGQTTQNAALVRSRIDDVLNHRNAAMVDQYFAPGCQYHSLLHSPTKMSSLAGALSYTETLKKYISEVVDTHYDRINWHVDEILEAGDRTVTLLTVNAAKNGHDLVWTEIWIDRFEDGKVVEIWELSDRLGMYQQLGLIPDTKDLMQRAGLN